MAKKFYIETLGCAMNVRDSEHIIAELICKEDYEQTDKLNEADLILINTCSVRKKPVDKLFSEIGFFNKHKKSGAKIGVCGCTASHLGEEIIKKAPFVDFVLGARNVSKITKVLHKPKTVEVDIDYDESQYLFDEFRNSPYKAYVNISIGCDKQCSFCIVPYTRGKEISIPADLILKEIKKAVKNGTKEVCLLGQNVNNYGRRFSSKHPKINFTNLLQLVSEIDGVERIRFTSPHPLHMDDEFLEEFAKNQKICKTMHMPLQSGSTKILKAMKRGYTKEWFLDRALKLRQMVPDVSISTDIIVAFPGESEEDFADTMDVVKKVRFEQIFSFKYSPRPLTLAKDYKDQIPNEIGSQRLSQLQSHHNEILDKMKNKRVGKVVDVYFEELKPDGKIVGRSGNNLLVQVDGDKELLGKIVPVKITDAARLSNFGVVIA